MLLLLLFFACDGKPADSDSAWVDDGLPHLWFVAPEDGAAVGTCVPLQVEVRNYEVVSPTDHPDPATGQGHWHLVFDARYFDCEALDCDAQLEGFDDGPVTLTAQLVTNDHFPVLVDGETEVRDTLDVVYTADGCEE